MLHQGAYLEAANSLRQFKKWAKPCLFIFIFKHKFTEKVTLDVRGIWTRIVGVEGAHTDHLTFTTAQPHLGLFTSKLIANSICYGQTRFTVLAPGSCSRRRTTANRWRLRWSNYRRNCPRRGECWGSLTTTPCWSTPCTTDSVKKTK